MPEVSLDPVRLDRNPLDNEKRGEAQGCGGGKRHRRRSEAGDETQEVHREDEQEEGAEVGEVLLSLRAAHREDELPQEIDGGLHDVLDSARDPGVVPGGEERAEGENRAGDDREADRLEPVHAEVPVLGVEPHPGEPVVAPGVRFVEAAPEQTEDRFGRAVPLAAGNQRHHRANPLEGEDPMRVMASAKKKVMTESIPARRAQGWTQPRVRRR